MTAIPPTIPDPQAGRPSTAVVVVAQAETFLNQLPAKIAALVFGLFFARLTMVEATSAEPSNIRLALGAVPTFFCLALLCTDSVVGLVQRLAPFVPAKWRAAP